MIWILALAVYSFLFLLEGLTHDAPFEPKKNAICLTMIVKNEASIIERCLNSTKDIVDCISICDTGSTDDTIKIIEKFLLSHNIPGKVHQHTWQNFGYNRTLSAQAAQKTLEENGFPLSHSYLLHLDADMILKTTPNFRKEDLVDDSYGLEQQSSWNTYCNTRLTRASLPWESVGVTHEYWSCKKPCGFSQLKTLWINDLHDGGCKDDKFERDIKLLTQGLEDEPDNERYMFYLADSYMCLKQYDQAIRWYKARIAKGNWKEEVWFSKFMIGECYENMGFWDHALHWYLDAYQYNPERAEPLQKIATHYRVNGQAELAYLFAKQGSRIPYPKEQVLFISHPVYNYQFDEEISIAAYYTSFKDEGFEAADRLALKMNIPQNVKEQTYRNLVFYAQHIKNSHCQAISLKSPIIERGRCQDNKPVNLSILKTDDGYHLTYRIFNLDTSATSEPQNEMKSSKVLLVHYDKNWNVLAQKEIIDHQKTGDCETVLCHETSYDFSHFRASAGLLPFGEGYLMLVNENVEMDNQPKDLHRFAFLNREFKIKQVSRPFVFIHKGFEHCGGMTIDHSGTKCIIPVELSNQEVFLIFVDLDTIRSALRPLP
jgi:glycosyltransferase involved in cell wall biosynthesis